MSIVFDGLKDSHLEGREFIHGTEDCYSLVRDFFRDNFGIELTNYARPDDWWAKGLNLYMDHFHNEGFRLVDNPKDLQIADVFLCAVRSPVANHAAVYVGEGHILHHFIGRRSNKELYKGIWRNTTVACIRHKDLFGFKWPSATIDIMDDPRIAQRFRDARDAALA